MPTSTTRSFRLGGPDLRVGDAERDEAADLLAKHHAEGRLDEAEYNDRLAKVRAAKTRSDFNGLFSDLPDLDGTSAPPLARHSTGQWHSLPRLLFLVLVVVITATVAHALIASYTIWLLIALLGALWLWSTSRNRG
jgi:Flp pilus assembly protein TadB